MDASTYLRQVPPWITCMFNLIRSVYSQSHAQHRLPKFRGNRIIVANNRRVGERAVDVTITCLLCETLRFVLPGTELVKHKVSLQRVEK